MDVTTVITVNGTRKSERSGGLESGEVNEFIIRPGEYDRSLTSVADLIAQIDRSAYLRGEWISSLRINDIDVVERIASEALSENHGNLETAVESLAEMNMFRNADAIELRLLVMQATGSQDGEP